VVHCACDLGAHLWGHMPTISNTDRAVAAAKAVGGKQTEYTIKGVSGLKLHAHPTGRRQWFFHYWPRVGGMRKHKAEPLGDANAMDREEANKLARALQVRLDKGEDPVAARQAETAKQKAGTSFATFGDLVETWLSKAVKAANQRSAHETEKRYHRHIAPVLGARHPESIERGDIIALLENVWEEIGGPDRTRGGHEVNRVQQLIHACYSWAISEGYLKHDPTYRLRYRHKEQPRARALTPVELKAIWHGLDLERFKTAPDHKPFSLELRDIYRLLVLLGQRKMEVAGMRKDELDLDAELPVWTIPSTRTKNGVAHRVPLPPLALSIVRAAVSRSKSGTYMFPSWQTLRPYSPVAVGDVSRLLRKELNLGEDIRVHDFRRTVGTQMASLRISSEDRARVFNHVRGAKTSVTTQVYDVFSYDDEKLRALAAWEGKLRTIVGHEGVSNVTPFRQAATVATA
jgi:integrase